MCALGLLWVCSVVALAESALDIESQGPFQLPLAETRLSVIAIQSSNNIELILVRPSDQKNVTVSLAMTKYENESQISAVGVGDNVAIVSRDELNLTSQLISIFRKNNVLAVYRAGQLRPVLVYENRGIEKIDFADFTTLFLTGPREGFFVQATKLEERGFGAALATPHGEAVKNELYAIQREINIRLRMVHAVYSEEAMYRIMPLHCHKAAIEMVETLLLPHFFLLDYYGVKFEPKFREYKEKLVKNYLPRIKSIVRE